MPAVDNLLAYYQGFPLWIWVILRVRGWYSVARYTIAPRARLYLVGVGIAGSMLARKPSAAPAVEGTPGRPQELTGTAGESRSDLPVSHQRFKKVRHRGWEHI